MSQTNSFIEIQRIFYKTIIKFLEVVIKLYKGTANWVECMTIEMMSY